MIMGSYLCADKIPLSRPTPGHINHHAIHPGRWMRGSISFRMSNVTAKIRLPNPSGLGLTIVGSELATLRSLRADQGPVHRRSLAHVANHGLAQQLLIVSRMQSFARTNYSQALFREFLSTFHVFSHV